MGNASHNEVGRVVDLTGLTSFHFTQTISFLSGKCVYFLSLITSACWEYQGTTMVFKEGCNYQTLLMFLEILAVFRYLLPLENQTKAYLCHLVQELKTETKTNLLHLCDYSNGEQEDQDRWLSVGIWWEWKDQQLFGLLLYVAPKQFLKLSILVCVCVCVCVTDNAFDFSVSIPTLVQKLPYLRSGESQPLTFPYVEGL